MSARARIDESTLTLVLDIRHPFAYLALEPAIEFAHSRDLAINWLPLQGKVLKPPSSPGPEDDRGILHRRSRAQMIAREVETYAAAQGLTLVDYYRETDAMAVHLGWLFLREFSGEWLEAYLRAVFRSYWAGDLAPEDFEAVALIVERVGGNAAAFRAWSDEEGPVVVAEIAKDLASRGVTGVPGYLVQGEFFQGRQHLPMIAWILDGRSGPGPI